MKITNVSAKTRDQGADTRSRNRQVAAVKFVAFMADTAREANGDILRVEQNGTSVKVQFKDGTLWFRDDSRPGEHGPSLNAEYRDGAIAINGGVAEYRDGALQGEELTLAQESLWRAIMEIARSWALEEGLLN